MPEEEGVGPLRNSGDAHPEWTLMYRKGLSRKKIAEPGPRAGLRSALASRRPAAVQPENRAPGGTERMPQSQVPGVKRLYQLSPWWRLRDAILPERRGRGGTGLASGCGGAGAVGRRRPEPSHRRGRPVRPARLAAQTRAAREDQRSRPACGSWSIPGRRTPLAPHHTGRDRAGKGTRRVAAHPTVQVQRRRPLLRTLRHSG